MRKNLRTKVYERLQLAASKGKNCLSVQLFSPEIRILQSYGFTVEFIHTIRIGYEYCRLSWTKEVIAKFLQSTPALSD